MRDLSVLIAARNEIFLSETVRDILKNKRGNTEIIVVCDGNRPDPPIEDSPGITIIYHPVSIGQRAAINEAAKLSTAEFIMKLDAHCAVDEGFDLKLIEPYRSGELDRDVTTIPRMYNLHAFDWKCKQCGHRVYQGPYPTKCAKCDNTNDFERAIVWKPRWSRKTDFARFDSDLHFQYWSAYGRRPESQGDIADVMSFVGACFFMHRDRYWEIGGLDEKTGSWGQMGVEISCKSWLSGGRQVVNKKTWFSHLFRTQPGFGFPYQISGEEQEHARRYSRWMWMGNNWEKAVHPLSWLIEKFAPVPDWDTPKPKVTKGLVYYTDNRLDDKIMKAVQQQLNICRNGHELISVSLNSLDFGNNFTLQCERGHLTMFKQILAGIEKSTADIIFLTEHDVLYSREHFEFVPPEKNVFYYNTNVYKLRYEDGLAVRVDFCQQTSGLCAYRELLLEHYRKRVERVEKEGYSRLMGFEPGTHKFPRGIDNYKAASWESPYPNIDIRHKKTLTPSRWSPTQFRNAKYAKGWTETREIPGWGNTQDILARIK